jgi:hypothetical protein
LDPSAAGRRHTAEEQTVATDKTFSVTRHTLTTKKPFDEFIGEIEERAPVVPPAKFEELADSNLPEYELVYGNQSCQTGALLQWTLPDT